MSVWVHLVFVLGVYIKRDMYKCRCECKYRTSESPRFRRDTRYRKVCSPDSVTVSTEWLMHAKSGGCLVIDVQRAVFAVPVCTCLTSSFRGAYHAAARWRKTGARCDRASRLAEMDAARAAHALLKIFNFCTRWFGCLFGAAGPMQWPRDSPWGPSTLGGDRVRSIPVPRASKSGYGSFESQVRSAEIEYSRSRFLGNGSEYPRAEYARRRSFDPGISEAVRNIQESSTLDGDRVLSVPRSLTDF